jgi:hypothetical protein
MKPHKHADAIKAWADGAEIEGRIGDGDWCPVLTPQWYQNQQYRVKPQPKPDRVERYRAEVNGFVRGAEHWERGNLILTFDGETGKLKSAEVL